MKRRLSASVTLDRTLYLVSGKTIAEMVLLHREELAKKVARALADEDSLFQITERPDGNVEIHFSAVVSSLDDPHSHTPDRLTYAVEEAKGEVLFGTLLKKAKGHG